MARVLAPALVAVQAHVPGFALAPALAPVVDAPALGTPGFLVDPFALLMFPRSGLLSLMPPAPVM